MAYSEIRHGYDVSDTERRRESSRDPNPWTYRPEYEKAIAAHLERCFHVPGESGLANQLIHLAVMFSEEHWHDFKDHIMSSARGSFLDELDEDNVTFRFQGAMTTSLAFLLLSRCGADLDGYFEPEDFAGIGDFDDRGITLALGDAVNGSASAILRQIEYAIRKYERERQDTVTGPDGNERRVINSKQTTLAAQKQQAIKGARGRHVRLHPRRRRGERHARRAPAAEVHGRPVI